MKGSTDLRQVNSLIHSDDEESVLAHFGVLGMKWGVRKDDSEAQQREANKRIEKAGKKALSLANKKYLDVYNAMADESADFYSKINQDFTKKYGDKFDLRNDPDPKMVKEYYQACADAVTKSLQKHSDRLLGSQVDPDVKITWTLPDVNSFPTFYVERTQPEVEHAENQDDRILLKVIHNDLGHIIQLMIPTDVNGELMHYGVIGMKWGIRKGESGGSNIKKDRKSALKNRRSLSDEELDKRINRLQKEKRFKDLQEDDITPGIKATKNFMSKYGGIALGSMAGIIGAKLAKAAMKTNPGDILDAIATTLVKVPKTIIG